jgi:hypothetical protein
VAADNKLMADRHNQTSTWRFDWTTAGSALGNRDFSAQNTDQYPTKAAGLLEDRGCGSRIIDCPVRGGAERQDRVLQVP